MAVVAERRCEQPDEGARVLHGILKRARRCGVSRRNAAAEVEKPRLRAAATSRSSRPGGGVVARPERGSEQDAAIFLTAAFTGSAGELLALRWREVDLRAPSSASARATRWER